MADRTEECVEDRSRAFWVRCDACNHCWAAAYYPAPAAIVAKAALGAMCPKCASKKVMVAKQDRGVLMEPPRDPAR